MMADDQILIAVDNIIEFTEWIVTNGRKIDCRRRGPERSQLFI